MATPRGYLSRDEYLALASKQSPLEPAMRPAAYDAFEEYLKKKKKNGLYDVCDLVFHLKTQQRRHSPLHKVVIDEVQDLTMAELALLHDTSADEDGFFICGDTAQTITRGVGFRFTDVKLLFGGRPKLAQLKTNFRTHAGILGAANALVGLVTRLFPNSLDRLDEEVGHFGGPPPALLPDTDPARVAEMMLAADDIGLGEMGANQVVIVRSASAKKKLPPLLRSGLVLTVEESKGLEFDDVCIFDFFADSDKACTWSVVGAIDGEVAPGATAPHAFDSLRDQVLCVELKMLYVAMTRARKRCFVYDSSTERRAPLFGYLSRAGVAESGLESLLSVTKTKSRKSSAQDWLRQAANLERNKLWAHAEKAYLKGADRANALVMGGKRLYFEAKEAKDAAATGRLLHLAAVALLQGAAAQPEGAAADRLRSSAAQVWCEAAETAPTPRSAAKSFYTKAAELLRDGFGRSRSASRLVDALSCFVSAAAQAPRDAVGWAAALAAADAALAAGTADERIKPARGRLSFLAASAHKAGQEAAVDEAVKIVAASLRWGA